MNDLEAAERLVRAALERDADRFDVYRLLLDHGPAWRPVERPADVPAGARHDAFRNAFALAQARDLDYCEGYTLPPGYDEHPNRHAWCVDGAGTVVDPSPGWADPGGRLRDCYFGIAIPVAFARPHVEGERARGVLYELTGRAHHLAFALRLG